MFTGLNEQQKNERARRAEQARKIIRRLLSSYSTQEIADKLGVTYLSVHNWKHGKFPPQDENMDKIRNLDRTTALGKADWRKR